MHIMDVSVVGVYTFLHLMKFIFFLGPGSSAYPPPMYQQAPPPMYQQAPRAYQVQQFPYYRCESGESHFGIMISHFCL